MDIPNFDGPILRPGDAAFEQASKPWNLAIEQPVLAVAQAAHAADVATLVRHAAGNGLTVTTQPSGHGASGDTEGTILLRTSRLDELTLDGRVARVGAGVKWGRLLDAAAPLGLTGLAGSTPAVNVTGYTLGGGLSWFSRKWGWAADSVRALEIVDAEGAPRRVSAETDPELFWALRGGGGDFAVVTALELDLHPAPELYGGRLLWPAERAPAVLEAFLRVTDVAPDELTVWLDLLKFPGAPPFVALDSTYLGPEREARALLAPFDAIGGLISDSRAGLPVNELGSIEQEPTDPSPGQSHAELLPSLEHAAALLSEPIDPLLSVQIRHLGGALSRPSDSAAGPVADPYLLYMFGIPGTGDVEGKEIALAAALGAEGRKPYTFLKPGEKAAQAFGARAHERLRDIKRRRDPHGVFRANYPI
ncbi:FAD-binding oxidoreductase [Nonomuraea sp. NPDC050790]|uniref:FAD-binding oxidoreductase n=1 Tax=Nonomuraea sp. NPDC050790 TaxID=3364371 RepID=UPI0037898278